MTGSLPSPSFFWRWLSYILPLTSGRGTVGVKQLILMARPTVPSFIMSTVIDQTNVVQYHHAKLLHNVRRYGVTIEDIARAWSSMNGKAEDFDRKNKDEGYYEGYMADTEEMLQRAVDRARARRIG